MKHKPLASFVTVLALAALAPPTASGSIFTQSLDLTASALPGQDLDGLSARALFSLDTTLPYTLVITLKNTSTALPAGTDAASQFLTALSFDLGGLGALPGDPRITGGAVRIGPGGVSINLDNSPALSAGADITGEWGYGNAGAANMLPNLVSAMSAHTTPFGGANLDGSGGLNGPQGGVLTNPPLTGPGGLGGFADSVVITLALDTPLSNLGFLAHGAHAEFGSDHRFATVPEPATLSVLLIGALAALRRRRR